MRFGWLGVLLLLVLGATAFGNGGGYYRGGVTQTGGLEGFSPRHTEKIRLVDEDLRISFREKAADVRIEYVMRNETNERVKVRFGFPVEETFDQGWMGFGGGGERPASRDTLQYCRGYRISVDGGEVRHEWVLEKKPSQDRRFEGIAGWLVSEVVFEAGAERKVFIQFTSVYPYEEHSVSEDVMLKRAVFKYRLSTAACWRGSILTGKITLEANGIPFSELQVIKPVNRFRKEGRKWVWDFEDLEPTLADDLEVEVRPKVRTYFKRSEGQPEFYVARGEQWMVAHANYAVEASSTLEADGEISYEAENIKNQSGKRAWSEGVEGDGVGEWLELVPRVPKVLAGIGILPGYAVSEGLFRANGRPRKLKITLNGSYVFEAMIPDELAEVYVPVEGFKEPVHKIRLEVQEVWEGSRYEDTCVSGVRLFAKLKREPYIEPAR